MPLPPPLLAVTSGVPWSTGCGLSGLVSLSVGTTAPPGGGVTSGSGGGVTNVGAGLPEIAAIWA